MRDALGAPKSVLSINTDITEKTTLEAQVLRAQRMESIGTLAGGIAHDLNNVLSPIVMSMELLKLGCQDQANLELLNTVEASARRGAEMVGQVLSFARGVEGQRVLVQPRHILKDIKSIIADTFPKSLDLKLRSTPDLWNVLGDPTQIHQVMLNLCVNSRDAMPDGGHHHHRRKYRDRRKLRGHEYRRQGRAAMSSCRSRTPAPACLPPFSRKSSILFSRPRSRATAPASACPLPSPSSKATPGSSAFPRRPVDGTKFRSPYPRRSHARFAGVNAEASTPAFQRGSGQCVLVVDDEAPIRSIARQTLEAFGYRVLLAVDGAEAVAIYAKQHAEIAIVLTDMMMPVMDGPATIQVLTKINPEVKIIAASGMNTSERVTKITNGLVKHFLPKPYTAESMLRTLATVLAEN